MRALDDPGERIDPFDAAGPEMPPGFTGIKHLVYLVPQLGIEDRRPPDLGDDVGGLGLASIGEYGPVDALALQGGVAEDLP